MKLDSAPEWMVDVRGLSDRSLHAESVRFDVWEPDEGDHWTPGTVEGYDDEEFVPLWAWVYPIDGCLKDPIEINTVLLQNGAACTTFRMEDEYGERVYVGLLGYGSNFSWDLAAAFMVAGHLPPAHIATALPWERSKSRMAYWIVQGCIETSRREKMDARAREIMRSRLKQDGRPPRRERLVL